MEDGLFERFPCQGSMPLHNSPEMPLGTVGVTPGPMQAAVDGVEIHIRGKGGHWRPAPPDGGPGAGGGPHHHCGAKRGGAQYLA